MTKRSKKDMTQSTRPFWLMNAVAMTLVMSATVAHGQTNPTGPSESDALLEEIVVTVERRSQSLQDFAGTAQAFTADDLKSLGVGADLQSLQAVVPGLQMSFNEGFTEIFIRGIGTQDNSSTSEQPTAVHYNGVYIPRSRGLGVTFFDLERVEVNQGPQGTLRGRNATAGSINIIPHRPETGSTGGKLSLSGGNYEDRTLETAVNVSLSDEAAVRVAYYSREHDEYFTNALRGQTSQDVKGAGAEDEEALRASFLWAPGDLSLHFVYDHTTQGGNGFPGQFMGQAQSNGFSPERLGHKARRQNFLTDGQVDNEGNSYILTANYDFGPVGAELIGSYRDYSNLTVNQRRPFQFGLPNPTIKSLADILTFDPDNFNTNYISDDAEATVLEARLYSSEKGPLQWTAGAFYIKEQQQEFRWDTSDKQLTQTNLGGPDYFDTDNKSYSFYADGSYEVTEKLRAKAGIRYTDDDKKRTGFEAQFFFGLDANRDGVREGYPDVLDLDNDGNRTELVSANLVRFSTPGFRIVRAGEQKLLDPSKVTAEQFFRNLVEQFGGRDTLDDLLAAFPGSVSLTTTSNLGLFTQSVKDDYIDWRAGLEYDLTDDHLLYATISTGTRSGGINNPIVQGGQVVNPTFGREKLLAYELGAKNQFRLGHWPVKFNAALFFYDYDDQVLQVAATADGGGFMPGAVNVDANLTVQNVNAGRSELLGLSLDGSMAMDYGFQLGWNFLLLDAEYKEAFVSDGRQNSRDTNGDGVPDRAPPNVDISGNQLVNASKFTAIVNVGQKLDMPWGGADWRLTVSHRSKFYATPFNAKGFDINGQEIPLAQMPDCCFGRPAIGDGRFFNDKVGATTLLNAVIGTNFGPDERYRFEIYGNNLTRETYNQKQIINHFVNIGFLNTPRVYGARFSAEF
jgi:iron complex outermembrane recepter protein